MVGSRMGLTSLSLTPQFLANSFLALEMPAEAVRAGEILRPIDDPHAIEIKARASAMQGHHAIA